jgi:AraC-like DNA-binding protein
VITNTFLRKVHFPRKTERIKAIREQIPTGTDQSFCAYRYEEETFETPYHFHPEVEIVQIEEGSGMRVVGDHTESFHPGDLCLFGSRLPHVYHAADAPGGASSLVVQFLPDNLKSLVDCPEMFAVRRLLSRSASGLKFSIRTETRARPMLLELIESRGPDRLIHLLQVLVLLSQDRKARTLASPGFSLEPDPTAHGRIKKAWQLILENFDTELDQATVARRLNMSPSAFSRFFRKATGKTFTEVLLEIRLGNACRLLLESDAPITEVCYRSGFRNLSNFNRHFKARYTLTPRQWRATV